MAAASRAATKTIFGMAAPDLPDGFAVVTPHAAAPAAEPAAPVAATEAETGRSDRKTGARKTAVPAPEIGPASPAPQPATAKDIGRTTSLGFDNGRGTSAGKKVDKVEKVERIERDDKTQPTRTSGRAPQKQTPILTYVGVGFAFGLVLLGIYQLVGRLAH
jgi:hypothetical protein